MSTPSSKPRSLLAALLVVLPCGVLEDCVTPRAMWVAAGVPACEGELEATSGPRGGTALSFTVKHLAPASRVVAEATVYVVWIKPLDGPFQNVGALWLDEDLEGRFRTMTPRRRFDVRVTPEASAQVEQPNHQPVLASSVDRDDSVDRPSRASR